MADDHKIRSAWSILVDTAGDRWRLDERRIVDFRDMGPPDSHPLPGIMAAHRDYLRHLIRTCAAATVKQVHNVLKVTLRHPAILSALADPGPNFLNVVFAAFRERWQLSTTRSALAIVRRFYVFSCDEGQHAGFDADAASAMVETVLKGNRLGMAVLSMDPDEGPLSEAEIQAFETAIGKVYATGQVPLLDFVATSLTLCLGCRPENLYWVEDGDLILPTVEGGDYILHVPRVKIGGAPRTQFMECELPAFLGRAIQSLVDQNGEVAPAGAAGFRRPLFRRREPMTEILGSPSHAEAYRLSATRIGRLITSMPARLRDAGHTNVPGYVNARRLRYTVVSREAAAGASPERLRDRLDHSSVDNIMIYLDARLEMVPELDRTVGPTLAPLANLFLGRGSPDDLRQALDWEAHTDVALEIAPSACLICSSFRPHDPGALRTLAEALGSDPSTIDVRSPDGVSRSDLVAQAHAAAAACDSTQSAAPNRPDASSDVLTRVGRTRGRIR